VLDESIIIGGASSLIEHNGNPQWRGNLPAAGLLVLGRRVSWHPIPDVEQPAVTDPGGGAFIIDSHQTPNLYGQYSTDAWLDTNASLGFGARNLTDEIPLFACGGYLGSLHQPQGRYVYASINPSF